MFKTLVCVCNQFYTFSPSNTRGGRFMIQFPSAKSNLRSQLFTSRVGSEFFKLFKEYIPLNSLRLFNNFYTDVAYAKQCPVLTAQINSLIPIVRPGPITAAVPDRTIRRFVSSPLRDFVVVSLSASSPASLFRNPPFVEVL